MRYQAGLKETKKGVIVWKIFFVRILRKSQNFHRWYILIVGKAHSLTQCWSNFLELQEIFVLAKGRLSQKKISL